MPYNEETKAQTHARAHTYYYAICVRPIISQCQTPTLTKTYCNSNLKLRGEELRKHNLTVER